MLPACEKPLVSLPQSTLLHSLEICTVGFFIGSTIILEDAI